MVQVWSAGEANGSLVYRDQEKSVFEAIYHQSVKSAYERIKNREFTPSKHDEAYLIKEISRIAINITESSQSFVVGSIILTDSVARADALSAPLELAYAK
jgi:hypothetical protein